MAAGAGPIIGAAVDCSTATPAACQDNELGYMFYQNLGGTSGLPILTSGDPDLTLFPSLQSGNYWSGTEIGPLLGLDAAVFYFGFGGQDGRLQDSNLNSWPVHAGNVGAVPVPAAVWLFGTGLLGLVFMARRKAA